MKSSWINWPGCLVLLAVLALTITPAFSQTCTPPPANMVSWWPGEGDGSDIKGSNHGTLQGTVNFVSGKVSQAFSFSPADGVDYVRVARDSTLEPTRVTVDAWVKADGSPGSSRYIVAKGAQGCTAASYGLYTRGGGLAFYVFNGSAYVLSPAVGAASIWNGDWHHVAGTYDGAHVRLYVDGGEVGTGMATSIAIAYGLPTSNDLLIGQYDGTCSLPFRGEVDEVEVFDTALSLEQIQAIYDAGSAGKCRTITVNIDVKPGSDPNCFNINGHGVIPVAILGSADFAVSNVNLNSLSFAGLQVRVRANRGPQCSFQAVNGDAFQDLVCQFEDDANSWNPGNAVATLTGQLMDGTPFEGSDSICIVP